MPMARSGFTTLPARDRCTPAPYGVPMATTIRRLPAGRTDPSGIASTLDLPDTWAEVPAPEAALAVLTDGRTLSLAIETNIVLTASPLENGATLASWQADVRAERLSMLPDLQILDARPVTGAINDELWYTSSVLTDPQGVTLSVRSWSRVQASTGLTLTLTTLPLVDVEHGAELDRIAASWTPAEPAAERTPDDDA